MKRKIPLRVMLLPLLVVAVIALAWVGGSRIMRFAFPDESAQNEPLPGAQRSEHPAGAHSQRSPSDGPPARDSGKAATPEEWEQQKVAWAQRHTPRVEMYPWSAPVFDGRAVVAEPRLLCYISYRDSDRGECKCFTEQATKYFLSDESCRSVATNGEPYNPYRRPGRILTTDSGQPDERIGGASPVARQRGGVVPAPQIEPAAPGAVIGGPQVSGYGDIGSGSKPSPAP